MPMWLLVELSGALAGLCGDLRAGVVKADI